MAHRYHELGFFDCNLYIGRPAMQRTCNQEVTVPSLRAELAELGVQEGLACHVLAREYHPSAGNELLLQALAGEPGLAPCWVLLPHHTGEMPEPEPLVAQMLGRGVRAAKLFPAIAGGAGHRFQLHPYVAGPLLKELERYRVPLFVDYLLGRRDDVDWREVAEVCDRYPNLPVVLVRSSGRSNRMLIPMMKALPNLHMETSFYHTHRGLEALVDLVGPDRILFGSNYPYNTLPGPVFRVAHSQVAPEAKRMIAGENLRRLLAGVLPGPAAVEGGRQQP
jgi:hypothetical protein